MEHTTPHSSEQGHESGLRLQDIARLRASRISGEVSGRQTGSQAREHILAILETGRWCSGEALAVQLGISRAAVGKHVHCLREAGHAIEAVTRKGYRLLALRDPLNPAAITPLLRTRVLGRGQWHVLEETASTSLMAARLAQEGAPEGTIVLTERQTAGRGKKGRTWMSLPRSLQFSLLLRPAGSAWDVAGMTAAATQAVARAVGQVTGLKAEFKAPNDVLIDNRKVAGILMDTGLRGEELDFAVLGIGLNVNALISDFPPHERGRFTSLLVSAGRSFCRAEILAAILEALEEKSA